MQLSADQILNADSDTFTCLRLDDKIAGDVMDAFPGFTATADVRRMACGRFFALVVGSLEPIGKDESGLEPTRATFLESAEADSDLAAMMRLESKVIERLAPERRVTLVPEGARIADRFPRKTIRDFGVP